jgi:hypothetical protein
MCYTTDVWCSYEAMEQGRPQSFASKDWAEAAFPINIVCEAADCGVRLQVMVSCHFQLALINDRC